MHRIAILGINYPPSTFIKRKVEALSTSNKFQITIFSYRIDRHKDNTLSNPDIKIIKLLHPDDPVLWKVAVFIYYFIKISLKHPKILNTLAKTAMGKAIGFKSFLNLFGNYLIISSYSWDIMHFEWVMHAYSYIEVIQALNRSYTVSLRGRQITIEPLLSEDKKNRLSKILRNAQKIHSVSYALKKNAENMISEPLDIQVIYNGVDTELFNGKCDNSEHTYLNIIFIGSLIWRKSIDSALYIFYRFLSEGGKGTLHIVGNGPEKPRMLSTINNLNLNDNVVYHGEKTEKEVAEILRDMDVLILTSFAEGLANVILEAMATCTVPIATNVQGNPEAITHGENGFLFSPLSIKEPVSYLLKLYHNPDLLYRMKIKAREKVESMFTLEKMQEGHIKFFMEAIK